MKLFSATFLLFFIISWEVQCEINISISDVNTIDSDTNTPSVLWHRGRSRRNVSPAPASVTAEEKPSEVLSWKQKFQNTLISFLPKFPENIRVHILMALKTLLTYHPTTSFFMGPVSPIIDELIARFAASKKQDKDTILNKDTTDAMMFRLMSQKIDEKNEDEFLQIATDSRLVKEVTSSFMNSLQKISDNFVAKYVESVRSRSK